MRKELVRIHCNKKSKDLFKSIASKKGMKLQDFMDNLARDFEEKETKQKYNGFNFKI